VPDATPVITEKDSDFKTRADQETMLKLSDLLVGNGDLESFEDLLPMVRDVARSGERFFRMDVKPPFPDTPDNWEDRLEAAFSGLVR
jgi:hypothetical protein